MQIYKLVSHWLLVNPENIPADCRDCGSSKENQDMGPDQSDERCWCTDQIWPLWGRLEYLVSYCKSKIAAKDQQIGSGSETSFTNVKVIPKLCVPMWNMLST